jgi:hypothetical protein
MVYQPIGLASQCTTGDDETTRSERGNDLDNTVTTSKVAMVKKKQCNKSHRIISIAPGALCLTMQG